MQLWIHKECAILGWGNSYDDKRWIRRKRGEAMADQELTPEELSKFGRYMAAQRRVVEGTCDVCGKQFSGTTKRRYCSNRCAVRAHRERLKQHSEVSGSE